jgi:hypothetical protein
MTKPVVGQEVAIEHAGGWGSSFYLGYTVKSVTPTGRCTVVRSDGHERKFNSDGYDMAMSGTYRRDRVRLDVDVVKSKLTREEYMRAVTVLINAVSDPHICKYTYNKESMQTVIEGMEARLAKAKEALSLL